jgi:hypothetical protein
MTCCNRSRAGLAAGLLLMPALAAAAVSLPSGDPFLNGTLDLAYRSSGAVRLDPVLYVDSNENFAPGALATVYAPIDTVEAATGLDFGYSVSGVGSGTVAVSYTVTNTTGLDWTGLRFFAVVAGDPFDALLEIAGQGGSALDDRDPARWGIDDFQAGDLFLNDVLTAATLDATNHCGATACAAEAGLEWHLDTLPDGMTWLVRVLLSEEGVTLGNVALSLTLADAAGDPLVPFETLHVSGTATLVPLPGGLALLAAPVSLLLTMRRRRPRNRAPSRAC